MRRHNTKFGGFFKKNLSILLTVFIISILFFAGPIQALTIDLSGFNDPTPTQGDIITIDATIEITEQGLIPDMPDVEVYIDGIKTSEGITIDMVEGDYYTSGYGYSGWTAGYYGYGYSGYGYGGYGYLGYGYYSMNGDGYSDTTFTYTITLDTTNYTIGEHSMVLKLPFNVTNGHTYESSAETFTIESSGSGSSGGSNPSRSIYLRSELLKDGYQFKAYKNRLYKFTIDSETHLLKVDKTTSTTATFTISSTPQTKTLEIGEGWTVDVDGDGSNDLFLELIGLNNRGIVDIKLTTPLEIESDMAITPVNISQTEDNVNIPVDDNVNKGRDIKVTAENSSPENNVSSGNSGWTSLITSAVVGAINTTTGKITAVIVGLLILGIIIAGLFIFYGGWLGADYFSRAAQFHKRAEKAHGKGKTKKAQKLYKKAEILRRKSRNKII